MKKTAMSSKPKLPQSSNSKNTENKIVDEKSLIYKMKKHIKKYSRRYVPALTIVLVIAITGLVLLTWRNYKAHRSSAVITTAKQVEQSIKPITQTGKIIEYQPIQTYSAAQTAELVKQTNHNFDLPITTGVEKQMFSYTSSDGQSDNVPIYGRIYMPANSGNKKLPVLAFAPGTTGIGDSCAGSLEDPTKRNWANYDSLMSAYASQGYVVVITDYEGMRDSSRIHHYMVGDLEGRAVLDSIRSLSNLDATKNNIDSGRIFAGGYSQGGHAVFWADAINKNYAPEISLKGVVGFGPVLSVNETLTDAITAGANINWFGPFVIFSYQDWYKRSYPVGEILLSQYVNNLNRDVLRECIDTVNHYYPNNIGANRSGNVYTPEFISAAKSGNISNDKVYTQFKSDMEANIIGPIKTETPKLINQGLYDNVVLPRQATAGYKRLCASGNTVSLKEYTSNIYAVQGYNPRGYVDHYQTMNSSFKDTLAWMSDRATGLTVAGSCK